MQNGQKLSLLGLKATSKFIFLISSIGVVVVFLLIANNLVSQLSSQEKERMNIWAQATQRLASAEIDADVDFLLAIISQNNSIPVMVVDSNANIIDHRNFSLPDKTIDSGSFQDLSPKNQLFIQERLKRAVGSSSLEKLSAENPHFIKVTADNNSQQYIYFEDSILLRQLSWYPYVQLAVMLMIVTMLFIILNYTKKAEYNKIWAGLSKETAHQLGTPISSLMAWNEYLVAKDTDPEITDEINKDIKRLSVIADRFSKIGSQPELIFGYLNQVIENSLNYLHLRISDKVRIELKLSESKIPVLISPSLFEWVMENLIKNAVDAMSGEGTLTISTGTIKQTAWIEIKDTGKGMPRKNFKRIFSPGYTTKKRGWGLGLTLTKRIIMLYHDGRIFVKESEPGKGSVFRIELPLAVSID